MNQLYMFILFVFFVYIAYMVYMKYGNELQYQGNGFMEGLTGDL